MFTSFLSKARDWRSDAGGNFTALAAITAPVAVLLIVGLVNYSNRVTLKQKTQAAADSAALAATTAYAQGKVTTATDAQAVAASFFSSNAPTQAVQSQTSFSATTTIPNGMGAGNVSTAVSYCGSVPSVVGTLLGTSNQVCVNASSGAAVTVGSAGTALVYGNSENWGDPHEVGANGDSFEAHCTPGSWYVIFSDANLQINGLCETYYSSDAQGFSDLAITVGGHQIYLNNFTNTNGYFQYAVDGVTSQQTRPGTYSLINSPSGYVMNLVKANSNPSDDSNYYQLYTPNYTVTVSYSDDGVINIATLNSNYNACAVPAGLLGQTYGPDSAVDKSGFDFVVPGGTNYWYQSPNYSLTCPKVMAYSKAKITQ